MPGKFELTQDSEGGYRFRLKASNGRVILSSPEGYRTRAACLKGIRSVMANADTVGNYAVGESDAGFRFVIMARNGRILGVSEDYATERARDRGISSVLRQAPKARIEDLNAAAPRPTPLAALIHTPLGAGPGKQD